MTKRGIHPENLPAEEGAKNLAQRVKSDEKKLQKEAKGKVMVPPGHKGSMP